MKAITLINSQLVEYYNSCTLKVLKKKKILNYYIIDTYNVEFKYTPSRYISIINRLHFSFGEIVDCDNIISNYMLIFRTFA